MSDEEQAGHILSHSKYIYPHQCPDRYKIFFLTQKNFLAVWHKDHMMFNMEMDVKMKGRFNI
jgi:hypothetical protein